MADSEGIPSIPGIEGLELIGRGGFAVVYRGRQPAFRRDVAVKVLERSGFDADDRRRFDRECQAMGALSDHPGIVTLHEAGTTSSGQPYLVMAYVRGGTLHDQLVASGPLGWQEVTVAGVTLSGALETAHRAAVLHRDIKPANVLRAEFSYQLSDFGIARIAGGHETQSGVITASIAHAAPEILDGAQPTARADVYALASTLFEALTGRAAFVRDTDEGLVPLIRRVLTEPPPDLREHGVPDAVAAVVDVAMAKDPADRYESAEAFGLALRGAQAVTGMSVTDLAVAPAAPGDASSGFTAAGRPPTDATADVTAPPARAPVPAPPAHGEAEPSPPSPRAPVSTPPPAHRRLGTGGALVLAVTAVLVATLAIVFLTRNGGNEAAAPVAPVTPQPAGDLPAEPLDDVAADPISDDPPAVVEPVESDAPPAVSPEETTEVVTTPSPRATATATPPACSLTDDVVGATYRGPARNETHDLDGRVEVAVVAMSSESCRVIADIEWADGLSGTAEAVSGEVVASEAVTLGGDFRLGEETYDITFELTEFSDTIMVGRYEISTKPGTGFTAGVGDGTVTATRAP